MEQKKNPLDAIWERLIKVQVHGLVHCRLDSVVIVMLR